MSASALSFLVVVGALAAVVAVVAIAFWPSIVQVWEVLHP